MKKGILGKKVGMTQVWTEAGRSEIVTAIQAGPCTITQIKTKENDGYAAIQIGHDEVRESILSKADKGHQKESFDKVKKYYRNLKEIRDFEGEAQVGDVISCDLFVAGENVMVTATTKGKGFQGVVKRYGFHGGRATHGSHFHRAPGSIGAGTYPGRVARGKKMPGRMGGKIFTAMNLEVIKIIPEDNLVLVRGSVPGRSGSPVFIYQK